MAAAVSSDEQVNVVEAEANNDEQQGRNQEAEEKLKITSLTHHMLIR